jgi:hypothetical protein
MKKIYNDLIIIHLYQILFRDDAGAGETGPDHDLASKSTMLMAY